MSEKIREFTIRMDDEHAKELARMSEADGEDNDLVFLEAYLTSAAISFIDGGWISVANEMPKIDEWVWTFDLPYWNPLIAPVPARRVVDEAGQARWRFSDKKLVLITHWVKIKPPKEQEFCGMKIIKDKTLKPNEMKLVKK